VQTNKETLIKLTHLSWLSTSVDSIFASKLHNFFAYQTQKGETRNHQIRLSIVTYLRCLLPNSSSNYSRYLLCFI